MNELIEFIGQILIEGFIYSGVWLFYGAEENPRHPFFRNLLRVFTFGGITLAILFFVNLVGPVHFAVWILTFLGVLIMLLGEYEYGSKTIAIALFVWVLVFVAVFVTTTWIIELPESSSSA